MAKTHKCSTCDQTFHSEQSCEKHISETHTRSGKGGKVIKIDNTPDYSDAAFSCGPHVYGL